MEETDSVVVPLQLWGKLVLPTFQQNHRVAMPSTIDKVFQVVNDQQLLGPSGQMFLNKCSYTLQVLSKYLARYLASNCKRTETELEKIRQENIPQELVSFPECALQWVCVAFHYDFMRAAFSAPGVCINSSTVFHCKAVNHFTTSISWKVSKYTPMHKSTGDIPHLQVLFSASHHLLLCCLTP